MADELETTLTEATWLPNDRRQVMLRLLRDSGKEGRALLDFALATGSVPAVEFWRDLCASILLADPERRLTPEVCRHGITVAGARTVRPRALQEALQRLKTVPAAEVPEARAALLALGGGVSLANAHGVYVTATRKAQKSSLPGAPPHLAGPVPELTVFETVEVALTMARLALAKKPNARGQALLRQAEAQLAWARGDQKEEAPTRGQDVPPTSRKEGPGFALARAALMEACNVGHVSARGTSLKASVMWGLELGEAWWLEQLDEALMLADARAAFEKRRQETSSPVSHLVWRGGDKTTRLWLVRLASRQYALLAKLGRNWTTVEGDLQSVAATVPDAFFPRAMPVIEQRR